MIVTEDRLYYWKIDCIIGRPSVLLEDQSCCWNIGCIIGRSIAMFGRSMILLEDQLY